MNADSCSLEPAQGDSADVSNQVTATSEQYETDHRAILSGSKWEANHSNGATVITFSFNSQLLDYQKQAFANWPDILNAQATVMTEEEKDRFRDALKLWEDVSGLEFVEVAEGQGQMAVHESAWLGETGSNWNGFAYYPAGSTQQPRSLNTDANNQTIHSDVFFDAESSVRFDLAMHEIGHAIGLKHTFQTSNGGTEFYDVIDPSMDNGSFSVMSYNRSRQQTELGSLDDDAARALYGETKSKIISTYELDRQAVTETLAHLKDFDGNEFGDEFAWKRIGIADVQGDGDTEYLYVNSQLGRWATLGPDSSGLIDMGAHGTGGDTRIVGIYIDPLVESGVVVKGSDHDSQQRFQNDLRIDNLAGILGTGDYDGDGLQEIYFALSDGTAYLHAYMHADGNIRYANYQSREQVEAFMQANGVESSTYADWFA